MLRNADIQGDKDRGEKMLEDPRLHRDRVRECRQASRSGFFLAALISATFSV